MKETYLFYVSDTCFINLFEDFCQEVKKNKCRKMDYSWWQKFNKWVQENKRRLVNEYQDVQPVRVSYKKDTNVITVCFNEGDLSYSFCTDPGGFGEYLMRHLSVKSFMGVGQATIYFTGTPETLRETMWRQGNEPACTINSPASNYYTGTSSTLSWGDIKTADSTTADITVLPITATNSITINDNTVSIADVNKLLEQEPSDYKIWDDHYASGTVKIKQDKENKIMDNKAFKFDFGKITDNTVRMSMYGLAVRNASGVWTAYDKAKDDLMDVDIFNFDASNMLYKMPVAIKDVKVGDVVIHARKPMFVVGKAENGDLTVVDPVAGEKKTIMPAKSPFGFNFCTRVVSLFDQFTAGVETATEAPSVDNPFGSLWMLAMLDNKQSVKDILPVMFMMNGTNVGNMNPMMLALMMSDSNDMKDMMIPLMLMSNK